MAYTVSVESAIRTELTSRGPCTLDALLQRLPQFSWSEMFTAIDQLSREGRLVLRHAAHGVAAARGIRRLGGARSGHAAV